jgi:hypothetical protein
VAYSVCSYNTGGLKTWANGVRELGNHLRECVRLRSRGLTVPTVLITAEPWGQRGEGARAHFSGADRVGGGLVTNSSRGVHLMPTGDGARGQLIWGLVYNPRAYKLGT